MKQGSNHWGIELNGSDEDKNVWRMLLKPPYDPFVEEVQDDRGNYLALRSTALDGVENTNEVHELAKNLFKTLNVVVSKHSDAGFITNGAVVEFVSSGQPKKHHVLEAEGVTYLIRGGVAQLTIGDTLGSTIERPTAPTQAQLWMHAAKLNTAIGNTLRYLQGNPSWVDLYKAWEELKHLPNGDISKNEINRFTQTANAVDRHRLGKVTLPKRPMELWEGRALITRWVSAAICDILAKNP